MQVKCVVSSEHWVGYIVSSGHVWTTRCSFSYFTSLFLEESNNTETRRGRGRGRKRQVRKIEGTRPQGIEALRVEVIGKIFSHVKSVEEVVRASGTCRKWRRAARYHWRHLMYLWRKDSAVYKNLTTVDLEVLLTQTILQTSSLQNLSLWTEEGFSVAVPISWFWHARDSLRVLTYGLQCFQALWLTCESVETFGNLKHLQ
jgi:hypothetical protein